MVYQPHHLSIARFLGVVDGRLQGREEGPPHVTLSIWGPLTLGPCQRARRFHQCTTTTTTTTNTNTNTNTNTSNSTSTSLLQRFK